MSADMLGGVEGVTPMEDDNKLSYFFLGLGLGVAVGVLFAPKSGAETRELLRSKAQEGTDLAKRRAAEPRDAATETLENLSAAVDAGKKAYRDSTNTPTD